MATTQHLVTYWLKNILEDSEEQDPSRSRKTLLRSIHRIAMWNMASQLHVDHIGVPAQACLLLERYIANRIRQTSKTDNDEWEELRVSLEDGMPLLMASCIQLAAKMASNKSALTAKIVRIRLSSIGISADIDELIQSEFQVFYTLGCKVPLWTSLDLAQLLVHRMELPDQVMRITEIMVDMAELKRNELQWRLRLTANVPSSDGGCRLRTIHLCAGAVIAATHMHSHTPPKLKLLASLTQTTSLYLNCIAGHIIVFFELSNK